MAILDLQAQTANGIAKLPSSKSPAVPLRASTTGKLKYIDRPSDGEKLYINIDHGSESPSNILTTEVEVTVHNARLEDTSLEENGFVLCKLQAPEDIDWKNSEQVEQLFYPEVEKVLKEATGATRVHIFDHTLRLGHLKEDSEKKVKLPKDRGPVGMVHVDYTHESGIDRLDALLPQEADKLRRTPFAIIQIWRPLRGPVRSSPLGMIDASTVEKEDLVAYPIRFPNRVGYNFGVHYNPKHKWYFADQIQTDEAYLFVCYHSRLDRARFTPHSAFKDLSVGDDAPPRESMELRSYVFWEDEEPREVQRLY